MKKVLFVYGILLVIVVAIGVFKFGGGFPNANLFESSSATAKINDTTYKIKIARTEDERMKGLSEIKSLPNNEGMLFIFEEKGKYTFWMKNTFIPLDIIHINDDKIVKIFENVPPQGNNEGAIPTYPSDQDANYVLEINGGQTKDKGFKVGDTVTFSGIE